jgi:DNA-binding transcriptional LysR family regulator
VLATAMTTLVYQLGRPIRRLRREFPHANIIVRAGTTDDAVSGLRDRQIDLGILVQPGRFDGLDVTHLFEEEMKVVVNPRQWTKKKNTIGVEELADLPLILYPRTAATRIIIDDFFHKLNQEPKVTTELEDTEAIKRLVESGFGCSILPEHAVPRNAGSLRKLAIEGHKPTRHVVLAKAKALYPRKLTVAISEFFQREFKAFAGA